MQSVNKLFIKSADEVPRERVLFRTEFFKMSNHKPVVLILTPDHYIYKLNVSN